MENVIGYYIFDPSRGWLQEDEKTWEFDFHGGAVFTDPKLADDIGKRESTAKAHTFYVLACMGSI